MNDVIDVGERLNNSIFSTLSSPLATLSINLQNECSTSTSFDRYAHMNMRFFSSELVNRTFSMSIDASSAHCRSSRKMIKGLSNALQMAHNSCNVHSLMADMVGCTVKSSFAPFSLATTQLSRSGVSTGKVARNIKSPSFPGPINSDCRMLSLTFSRCSVAVSLLSFVSLNSRASASSTSIIAKNGDDALFCSLYLPAPYIIGELLLVFLVLLGRFLEPRSCLTNSVIRADLPTPL
mmetsp:Transcript_22602/g.34951  ORF Transcript_22602/g.34951 Transcript_22602/m.34951 type:complete len:236 (-) Transcript_22602:291-998(-)